MSNYKSPLFVFEIPVANIRVSFVHDNYRGKGSQNRKIYVISDDLTYQLKDCPTVRI